ncbi:hypothetical protein EVG20_g4562 [Dentipellis fragilis]|uniref:Major facilitator superfamily (MFS) profile domain-containing protein n=1 Tax=Dentipellis fragilis TaxID=205917 RepID=A0A4Y9YXQ8_9AGAM|nr:hypothetical protein EVG20_g4562 [Dentipellis fragilis]
MFSSSLKHVGSKSEAKDKDKDKDKDIGIEDVHSIDVLEEPELRDEKTKIKVTNNADYAAAVEQGHINPFTWSAFVLYMCASVAFLCSCGNGYDGSLMTAINGMPFYERRFNQGSLDVSTGLIFSIYTVGQMCGSLFAGQLCDRFGRRSGMFVGCVIIMVGAATIASSEAKRQFVAGRFVLGFGIAIATIGAPTYTVEVAPPQWRGRLTSLYNTGWNGGAIAAAAITLGTQRIQSDWSWRIPLILQAAPACVVVCTVWFLPESPRWLMAHGRDAEAFAFLTKYHGNGDPNHPIVKLQTREFKEGIRTDGSDKRWWDFRSRALFATNNARWRFLMVFLMGFFGQMSGNGLGYFNLSIYESLGFGTQMQFNMNLINSCLAALTAWVAVSLEDRMPRRKVLVIGTFLCAVMLALNAAFSAKWATYGDGPKNLQAVGNAGVAFFFLFGIVYAFTYTPLQSLYPAECLETTTRAKGVSAKIFIISCTSFINLFCTPIAYGRIGWRYVLVYVGWDAFETVIWRANRDGRWRYDRMLRPFHSDRAHRITAVVQELDEIFSSENPVKASKQKRKVIITEAGEVKPIEESP